MPLTLKVAVPLPVVNVGVPVVTPAGSGTGKLETNVFSCATENPVGHGTNRFNRPLGLAGEPGGSVASGPDRNSGPGEAPSETLMPTGNPGAEGPDAKPTRPATDAVVSRAS
jgi:hypothetical protein